MANLYSCVFHGTTWTDGGWCGECQPKVVVYGESLNADSQMKRLEWTSETLKKVLGYTRSETSDELMPTYGGNWIVGYPCNEESGSLAPVFGGVDVGASDDLVVATVYSVAGPGSADGLVENMKAAIEEFVELTDPMDRVVDGKTVRMCLALMESHVHWADRGMGGVIEALTPVRKRAASAAWSAELKRKTAEAKERERCRVVVDDDRWEE